MPEIVTSTGSIGQQFDRSDGRAYWNVENQVTNGAEHLSQVWDFQKDAFFKGRRRWVVKGRYSLDAVNHLTNANAPIEARIPLNLFDQSETDSLLYLAKNFHRSEAPEWGEVLAYWRSPTSCEKTPVSRLSAIQHQGAETDHPAGRFGVTGELLQSDTDQVAQIWQPFGWTKDGVEVLRNRVLAGDGVWFSGIFDRSSHSLVSACMGERFDMAGMTLVESTEYGTLPGSEGKGFCTAAVSFLNAQILRDTKYHPDLEQRVNPIILAELNMSSRADVVARHAGFRVPLIDQYTDLNSAPFQVLFRNVSVGDRLPENNLDPDCEHRSQADRFREAYGENFGTWRNSILGVLSQTAIDRFYTPADVDLMLGMEGRRKIYVDY